MSEILLQSPQLLILDKPAGVPSQPIGEDDAGTALALARAIDPHAILLHRLDTGTSGALAFARTQEAYDFYRAKWTTPEVTKIYRAVVQAQTSQARACLEHLPFLIDAPLIRLKKTAKRMEVHDPTKTFQQRQMKGAPLEARTRILKIHACEGDRFDLEIQIETGVMHQIRCHLAHLGLPILGDPLYSPPELRTSARLYLHAWKLRVPRYGAEGIVEAVSELPLKWKTPEAP